MVWQTAEVKHITIYAFSSISRFGVPVFVMISGALLLNRNIEIKSFITKKIKRLVVPFIFIIF
jgi:surface polysaccharide O-acyltransferase-like enzyme